MENQLYQHGTLGALMAGLMAGTTSIRQVLEHGNLGLGTLHGLDGEVIIVDGQAYQGSSDGVLHTLTGSEMTPYAAVTNFQATAHTELHSMTDVQVKEKIQEVGASENLFLAVKLTGTFKKMRIRIMPKQEAPYKRLVEVSKEQPEFEEEMIQGTVVGFFTPELFQGVAAGGYHLHFVDDAHTFGGHILAFELEEGMLEVSRIESLIQHFPIDEPTFTESRIDYADLAAEIEAAEN
ncbi:MAG: acetolactate decarboxylase [Enterococcus sp.]